MQGQPAPAQPAAGAQPDAQQKDPRAAETHRKLGLAAMKIIYDKNTSKQLVEMMKAGADNPAQVVAQAASVVLGQMQEKVQGIEPKLVYTVTPAVVVFLMELAGAAKIFTPDMKIAQAAIQMVGEQASGPQQEQAQPAAPPQGMVGKQIQQPGMMGA